jgi:hypothetical protein
VEGGLGALAFLALCKVGFVSGFCVPCNVLKIAWGWVGKVMDACMCAGCSMHLPPTVRLGDVAVFENRQPVTAAKFINKSSLLILLLGFIRRLVLRLIANKKMRIYSSPLLTKNCMCMLHNSQCVHKDICFWLRE